MLSGFVGVPSLDQAYWSLFVEMKFYALVAAVLIIGRIHQVQLFLIVWLFASIAHEILPVSNKLRAILVVDYSAYFIAGATFFLIWSQGMCLTRMGMIIVSWCLALYQSADKLIAFEKNFSTEMNGYIVAGIISTFFFVMLLISLKRTSFLGCNRWRLAGVITYPLYLVHQNIGFMIFNVSHPVINLHVIFWGTVLFIIGVAYCVHIFIEQKFSLPMKNAINGFIDFFERLAMR